MKIGIYTGTIPPPVFIENLVNGLADNGEAVYVYGKSAYINYQFSNSSIKQRKIPNTTIGILFYSIYYIIRLIIIQPQSYKNLLKIAKRNSKSWVQCFNRFCRIIPPFLDKLDIFHIQWAKTLVQYPEFIEELKCSVVLSLRGAHINYSPLADEQLAQGYIKYFPKVVGFHAVSTAIEREAIKYGACQKNISVIRPAVKQELINNAPIKNDLEGILNIISIGRCHWKKGYTSALDAMVLLRKEFVEFHYTIIASGKDHENLNYQIQDLGLNDYVTFINGLPHDKIIKKMSASDLFLLPSFEEGISNAVIESMALGISVISTDCGGMNEVIVNNYNGFLIPFREPGAMAHAIQNFIILDDGKQKDIVNNARETIIHNHLLTEHINQFRSFYNKMI